MSNLLKISDEKFWYQIGEAHQENGGVYKIVCVNETENIFPIWRLLGEDKEGVLYIGKANSFLDRVINLKKSTDPKYKSQGHDFGKVYKSHQKLMERFPYENLRAILIQDENPDQLEKQELEKYEKEFGELPPFNHKR